ncbi:hypothetical protein ILUMI_21894 [Ignelater luminosus]|uniref:K Homology domain-containing protein n=1 Tax=Ignelater luminosus TaxID=2038154 RepID=A0A8K0CBL0_IGNLU|nr:hypothetical protein ILUMI_21894 [Ignelater luminosus]
MDAPGSDILFSKDPLVFTNPKLINIGEYCVRDFQVHTNVPINSQNLAPYEEDDNIVSCMDVEYNYDMKITKTGKFLIEFHVPSAFFGSIIGSKGVVRRKIEQDTHTSIKIPRQGEEGDVIITGGNERDVIRAKSRVDIIIWQTRDKHPLTHFVSVPMVSDMIKHNFDIFKANLLTGTMIRGLDASMFQNPNKLHLTIATLVLLDEVEQNQAVQVLKQCKEEIINPLFTSVEPLRITLRGLEIMNDDPTNVDVLYGKVSVNPPKYNDCFQKVADGIVNYLANKGLVRRQYESVKLHVTLINSLFRKTNTDSKQKREPFDSTLILEKYKNFHFGEEDLNYIHLSVRFTTSEGAYYDALTTVSIK